MSDRKTILITGASGFIGRHAVPFLSEYFAVRVLSLREPIKLSEDLQNVDVVLFLTGIADQSSKIDTNLYYQVNRDLAVNLAIEAKKSGVKQFIYISTIKVFGEGGREIYNEDSVCIPKNAYGKSKLEAEGKLNSLSDECFIVSIIRPAVVYGRGAKGNIRRIMTWVERLPIIPSEKIPGKRSMVYIENLLLLIKKIIEDQVEGTFISSDDNPYTISEIVKEINRIKSKNKKIIAFPRLMKKIVYSIAPGVYERLFEDFIVDNTKTNRRLNFIPPYNLESGLAKMAISQTK